LGVMFMIKQMFDVCLSAYDMRVKTGSRTLKPYTILQTECGHIF